MQSSNIAYVPALDHIRAYAALLALFYHGLQLFWHQAAYGSLFDATHWLATANPLLALLVEGHTAVALFMVLSGFIFTWGAKGRNIVYRSFIRNRLLRTYPLFIALIVLGISAMPERFSWQALLTTVFGLANMAGHLDISPFSAMFWAVAVEWHFYLLFPFLLLFLNGRGAGYLLGLIALVLAWRSIAWLLTGEVRELAYFTIAGRLDQFLIGMLAGAWCAREDSVPAPAWIFPLVAALVIAAVWLFHRAGGWPQDNALRIAWGTFEGALWAAFLVAYLGFARETGDHLKTVFKADPDMAMAHCLKGYFFLLFTVPESPRWLFSKGDRDQARVILTKACGAEMAEADLYQWEQQMDGAAETRDVDEETRNSGGLVNPRACLTGPPGGGTGLYTLTIVWRGAGEMEPTEIEGCDDGMNGTNLYGSAAAPTNDLYRRATTTTFFVTI